MVDFSDSNEQVGQYDFRTLAEQNSYHIVSGCAITYSGSDLEVTVASGLAVVGGDEVAVAGDTVLLVPDGANPRWAVISIDSDGDVNILHGTAQAVPSKPDPGNETFAAAIKVPANLTIADNATVKLDKRFPGGGNNTFTAYSEAVVADDSGGTYSIDLNNGTVHEVTLDDDCAITFTNPAASGRVSSFTLVLIQDNTGSHTATFTDTILWAGGSAPELSTGADEIDVLTFFTLDGGAAWYGFVAGQVMS